MKKLLVSAAALVSIASWAFAFFVVTNFGPELTQTKAENFTYKPHAKTAQARISWQPRIKPTQSSHDRRVAFLPEQKTIPQVLGAKTESLNLDELTQEQAIFLNKPGVVNIINSLTGSLAIPDFNVDLKTFALTPRDDLPKHVIDVDTGLLGSGFVVNPDGYIITNAHVIAKTSAYDQMTKEVETHYAELFKQAQDNLSDKEYKAYQNYLDSVYGVASAQSDAKIADALYAEIDKFVEAHLEDLVKQSLVVIDKSMADNKLTENSELAEVFETGLPVTIVDFDEDFETNYKDVALIKISEKNLPALLLGSSESLVIGEKAISLGYPSNAKISQADLFEATFTEGALSAIKTHEGQKIIQLDNKISPGSSGGPLIDRGGNVIGIITFETGARVDGDNFGFALPVELAKEILEKNNIKNEPGPYRLNLLLGLASQKNSVCKQALDYFNAAASSVNLHFPVKDQLKKPISECESLIADKQSKDSAWDVFRIFYQQHLTNAVIFSVLVLIILAFGIMMLVRFFRHLREHKILPNIPSPPRPV